MRSPLESRQPPGEPVPGDGEPRLGLVGRWSEAGSPGLETAGGAVLACLEAINHRVNGPVPSAKVGVRQDTIAIAEVAYPIACIIESCLWC